MSPVQLERRARQRFDFNLPVSLRLEDGRTGSGFTQNLSARGLFLCTDMQLKEGQIVELTLSMPSEVTLSEAMRVRCQAKVLRVHAAGAENKSFAAIQLEKYEYLPKESDPAFLRLPVAENAAEDESFVIP